MKKILIATLIVATSTLAIAQGKGGGGGGGTTTSAVMVVDKNGKTIGRFMGTEVLYPYSNDFIRLPVGGYLLPVSSGMGWGNSGTVLFESSNCTGQAYILPSSGGTKYLSATITSDGMSATTYVSLGPSQIQQITANSDLTASGCILDNRIIEKPWPVNVTIDNATIGVPPFFLK